MRAIDSSRHTPLIVGLILLGALSRLVPHPWNATPLTAIALFGGTYLARRWAILLPLATVVASDLILGLYPEVAYTWAAFALTGALAWWVRTRPDVGRIALATVGGSVLFFLITNFGVWAGGQLYPMTAAGLWQSYLAGIPFFRGTVLGDAAYSAVLFGTYSLLTIGRPAVASRNA